jgi:hypothetical protein
MIFQPPMDSLVFQLRAPDSVTVLQLYTTFKAHWNDTIIDRGVKQPASNYNHGTIEASEFFSGTTINYNYKKYKATDYYVKIEYWFEYAPKPRERK